MKFNLIDKIESLSDDRIVATKQVSLAEEYLADKQPELAEIDNRLREHNRRRWEILNATRTEIPIEAAVQRS